MTDASDIQTQLEDLTKKLSELADKVSKIEDKLILIPDINRYGQLQEFLAAGDLKQADRETAQVILEAVGKNRESLTPEDMRKFPCSVLQVVDRLWRRYSGDRFGFTAQLAIYEKAGGTLDTLRSQEREPLAKFAEEVGWYKDGESQFPVYDQWDFSSTCREGSLPAIWWKSPYGIKMVTFCFLRLFECNGN